MALRRTNPRRPREPKLAPNEFWLDQQEGAKTPRLKATHLLPGRHCAFLTVRYTRRLTTNSAGEPFISLGKKRTTSKTETEQSDEVTACSENLKTEPSLSLLITVNNKETEDGSVSKSGAVRSATPPAKSRGQSPSRPSFSPFTPKTIFQDIIQGNEIQSSPPATAQTQDLLVQDTLVTSETSLEHEGTRVQQPEVLTPVSRSPTSQPLDRRASSPQASESTPVPVPASSSDLHLTVTAPTVADTFGIETPALSIAKRDTHASADPTTTECLLEEEPVTLQAVVLTPPAEPELALRGQGPVLQQSLGPEPAEESQTGPGTPTEQVVPPNPQKKSPLKRKRGVATRRKGSRTVRQESGTAPEIRTRSLIAKLPIPKGYILTEDMAPVRDPNDVNNSIRETIHNIFDITQTVVGFVPGSQDLLIDRVEELSRNLAHLQRITDPNISPNNPIHDVRVAPEVVDYVDDGRNPDIFTRDHVEVVQRGNAVMNGKREAFGGFAEIFAQELKKGIKGVDKQVDMVMDNAGMKVRGEIYGGDHAQENGDKKS